jgi:hypothetical protein
MPSVANNNATALPIIEIAPQRMRHGERGRSRGLGAQHARGRAPG